MNWLKIWKEMDLRVKTFMRPITATKQKSREGAFCISEYICFLFFCGKNIKLMDFPENLQTKKF